MHLRVFSSLAILVTLFLFPINLPATEEASLAAQQLQLEVAVLYERLHDWGKAEAQFLEAAKGPSAKLKAQALAGLERARNGAESSADNSSLDLGKFYEGKRLWSEAEKHYLDAAKDSSKKVRSLALQGLERVRGHMPLELLAEDLKPSREAFDFFSGLISRVLAVGGVLVILALLGMGISGVFEIRRRIEVLPFVASSEAAGVQLTYWLGYAQAMVQNHGALPGSVGTMGFSALPYLQLPGLEEKLPGLGEITIAGVKVPAGELLQRLGRPRVRVSGGWITDASPGRAFAEFERRRGLLRYELYATINRDIPTGRKDQELEIFAYQILIRAMDTYGA